VSLLVEGDRDWILYCLLPGERDKLKAHQNYKDPITGAPLAGHAAVDHDHSTGLIRGVLNWRTNRILEIFESTPNGRTDLGALSRYLNEPPAIKALGGPRYGVVGRISRKKENRRYGPHSTKEPFESQEILCARFGLSVPQ